MSWNAMSPAQFDSPHDECQVEVHAQARNGPSGTVLEALRPQLMGGRMGWKGQGLGRPAGYSQRRDATRG